MPNICKLMVVAALALAACESPEEKAADAVQARQAANRKAAQIEDATERKEVDVQSRANEDISGIARAGERRIAAAKSTADRKDNEATQALWVEQERARSDASRELDALGQDLADLRPALERKLSATAATTIVTDVNARVDAVRKNILDLDGCSASDLESIKSSIRAGLTDLKEALAAAHKRA